MLRIERIRRAAFTGSQADALIQTLTDAGIDPAAVRALSSPQLLAARSPQPPPNATPVELAAFEESCNAGWAAGVELAAEILPTLATKAA